MIPLLPPCGSFLLLIFVFVFFMLIDRFSVCLCELACDISTLNLILKCIEYMLLGNSLSPWQPSSSALPNGVENHSNAGSILGACFSVNANRAIVDTLSMFKRDVALVGLTSSLHSTSSSQKTSEESFLHQPLLDYVSSEQVGAVKT